MSEVTEAYLRAGEIPETVHRELRGHPSLLRTNQSLDMNKLPPELHGTLIAEYDGEVSGRCVLLIICC